MRLRPLRSSRFAASASVLSRSVLSAAGVLATTVAMAACSGRDAKGPGGDAGGTVVISTATDADFLFPPLVASSLGRAVTEVVFDHLAEVGDSLNVIGDQGFTPHLAERWTWAPDSLSVAFAMNPKARWHDGTPVRANDVTFTYRTYTDSAVASPLASLLDNIDSVTTRDSLTAVFWFKRKSPLSFFDAAQQMLILPEHVYGRVPANTLGTSELIRQPVGSGRFRFVRWVPGSTIEVASDTGNYRGRAMLNRVIWSIAPDFTTAVTKLFTGEADFFEAMRPEHVTRAATDTTVRIATYPSFDYALMMFNLRDPKAKGTPHPIFGDREVRRALTMGIDRKAIVSTVFDTLAVPSIGPMVRSMPTTDTTVRQIPYDPARAAAILDSLGWRDSNGDGVREKNGRPMAFTIITPSSSRNREQCAVLIQDQLKKLGVKVTIQSIEPNTFMRLAGTRAFDAAMQAWKLDASPATSKQIWSSSAATDPAGNNYGHYASALFDAQFDSALTAPTLAEARAAFKKANQTIIDDAPGVWMYELKSAVGYNGRIKLAPLRADAWWANLADWTIPANKRIARDNIPTDAAPR